MNARHPIALLADWLYPKRALCMGCDSAAGFTGRDWLCEDCADRLTVICDHCDERIYAENAIEDEHYSLCHDCDCIIRTYSAYYDGRRSHLLRKLLGRSRGRDSRV